jgi:C4-dicarboxylate transporter DctM subunit
MVVSRRWVRVGYKPAFAAALMAIGGAIGVIIPPSITFVVYGSISNASIAKLLMSGIIPGLMMGAALIIAAVWVTKRENIEMLPKASRAERLKALKDASWGLSCRSSSWAAFTRGLTPTEAPRYRPCHGILIGVFIYHRLDLKLSGTFLSTRRPRPASSCYHLLRQPVRLGHYGGRTVSRLTACSERDKRSTVIFFMILKIVLLMAGALWTRPSAFYILRRSFCGGGAA